MSWMTSIAKATNWLDSTIGTGGAIARTVLPAIGSAQSFYQRNIAGSFIEGVGKDLAGTFAQQAIGGGGGQPGYQIPLPQTMDPNFTSRVRPGSFTASQAKSMGWDNPRVKEAYSKLSNSKNPSIQAALDMVRPTIGKRGPTKSLTEAQVGIKRS